MRPPPNKRYPEAPKTGLTQVIVTNVASQQTRDMDANPPNSPVFSIPAVLTAAPHRLLFFVGAINVLAAMVWWSFWSFHMNPLPVDQVPAGWLHGFIMQYQMLPSFMFGFLLTTFPRWMGQAELGRKHYVPVGLGMFLGQALCLVAAFTGLSSALHLGVVATLLGWGYGLLVLGRILVRDRFKTWHAVSCWAGLCLGFVAMLLFAAFLHGASLGVGQAAVKLGVFGVLLPVYASVAHRMFPFFAGRVVPGYQAWRPMWLLAVQWPLWLAHVVLDVTGLHAWLWLSDLPLLLLALVCLWKWWPRGPMPAILRVLFIGYSWLPLALALFVAQSLWLLLAGESVLGRAPLHALAVGMFGSLLVAMVTRVTQGHAGRPLVLGRVALFAFVAMQAVALTRIASELPAMPYMGLVQIAALGWLAAFAPWVLSSAWIYLRPRIDGRPG